tara:strand:- start:2277 stop:2810 length:534 start_codon:yes stop_codon:yes gene_type:complete
MTKVDWKVKLKNKVLKIEKLTDDVIQSCFKAKNNYISYCNSNYSYVERPRLIEEKINEINLNQEYSIRMMNIRHVRSVYWYVHYNLFKIFSFEKKLQALIYTIFQRRNALLEEIKTLNLKHKMYSREDKIYIKRAKNGLKKFGKFKKFNFKNYGINIKMSLRRVFNRDIAYEIISFI